MNLLDTDDLGRLVVAKAAGHGPWHAMVQGLGLCGIKRLSGHRALCTVPDSDVCPRCITKARGRARRERKGCHDYHTAHAQPGGWNAR